MSWDSVLVKKPVSKDDIRQELQQEVESFLEQGGSVQRIPQGISGKEPGDPPVYLNRRLFVEPRTERTQIPEVIAAIDARRKEQRKRTPERKRSRKPQPRRKIIYDDFGEPLRKVWVED